MFPLFRRASIVALSLAAFVQGASAAPAAQTWTGFYIGANFGGGWGKNDTAIVPNDVVATTFIFVIDLSAPFSATSFKTSGVLGGLQLGYNWQAGSNWLIGMETDFDGSSIKGSSTVNGYYTVPSLPFSNTLEERIKWFGTVRGRVGYLPSPNLLLFVTGGLAYGQVQHTGTLTGPAGFTFSGGGISFVCAGGTCLSGSSSSVAAGWTLGGGIEYALWQNWTLKGEYLYASLNGKSITQTAAATDIASPTPASFNVNFGRTNLNIARLGLNWHF